MRLNEIRAVETDVAIVGGGTAGVFAAMGAAAAGAETVLIEKNGILGGTVTTCGINYPGLFFAWGKQVVSGFAWEAIKRTEALGGCVIPEISYDNKQHWLEQVRLNSFIYACVLDEMCAELGVRVRLHSMLAGAEEDESGVTLWVAQKDGLAKIHAKKVIDATADANLTEQLGYPCVASAQLQPATLSVKLDGYDRDGFDTEALTAHLQAALETGELPSWTVPATVARGVFRGELRYHVHVPHGTETSVGKTELEQTARREALAIVRVTRAFPGLEKLYVSLFAEECGVRETKRIVGEHTITAEEYISGTVFDDAVCFAFYPIDLHVPPYGVKQQYFEEGLCGTVPYRALIPQGSKHLLVAGRILSSDTDANSALRVQAPCMAAGQAAGCAAALAAKGAIGVSAVDYGSLCDLLREQNAIVPNKGMNYFKK